MKKSLLIISLMVTAIFVFSGCANSQPKTNITSINLDNAYTEEGEKLYCTRESVTGTHIKTTTCLTKAQKDEARRNSEDYVTRLKRMPEYKSSEPGG